ncbi:cubilin homolog [Bactrocera neohumeralis]|uniref:cubilin homolog n=1 Tax=Bactrocera neohumeralis TaxID=98809 RepID=UPI0021653530|nr:cubilin homolog [Bactrocera neohumeralis]
MSLNRIILSCRGAALLIVFIIYLENPVDGFVNSPKIITKDGNLIVESGLNRNITFRLDGSSRININDEYDLLDLLLVGGTYNGSSSKRKDVIEADNLIQLSNEYNTLRSYVFGTNGLNRRLNTMLNRTRMYNRSIQRFQTRLQSVERRVQSLQQRLELDSCKSNPCDNGGTCINMFGSFLCQCTKNFEGATCQKDVNECALYAGTDLGCQNGGQCVNQHGGYNCICTAGWYGIHCTQRKGDCMQSSSWELCGHGTCVSSNDDFGYKCICDVGWKTNGLTPSCTVDVDECNESHPPCETKCINLPGSFTCSPCAAGLTGNGVNCRDIDECATQNGGCSMSPRVACINTYGSYHCGDCPLGWIGDGRTCERRGGNIDGNGATATSCALNNYCHPLAKCTEVSNTVVCSCPAGMVGSGVGLNGCVPNTHQRCDVLPCMNGGTCVESNDKFICICPMGYTGPTCADITNSCSPNPCRNNGRCRSTGGTQFECRCAPGFSGRLCDARFSRCGGILTGMTGHLKYPQGSAYDHMAQCAWVIRTNESLVLNVTFSAFELEDATECRFDWLQINDGRTAAAQIIGRFCGTRKPRGGNIISSSSDLYLWFRSDNSTAKAGFELDWNSVPPQCGGIIELESHGTVSSPGSPGNYPKNRDCQWHLKAPNNKRIKLTFFSLQIEKHDSCNFDYLEIIDAIAESTIVKYCNSTAPSPLLLPTNEAIIRFHSDNIDTDAGFQIYYSTEERVPGCGGTYTTKQGTITSPNSLEDSISCEYDIKMPMSESIKIEFKKFELGDDDCLEFFDRNPSTQELTLQAKYCGAYNSNPPVLLHSLYNGLRIKYFAKRGKFELKYEADCSYTYESPNGIVMSPGYPVLSNIERFCNYKITTEPNTVISVKLLDFDIKDSSVDASGCAFSSLRINDGLNQNIMGPYCGNSTPPIEFVSKANMLILTFKTGITTWGKGFKLEYLSIPMGKTDCGGVFTKPGQKIRLPTGENEMYLDNMECYWVIMAPEGKGIMINWNSFRLEKNMDCMYDYVEIFDTLPKADDAHPLGRYCESPPSFSSYSRLLTLKFVSDSSESDAGFEATYEFLDLSKHCGGEIFSSTGRLYSPDYPSNYTNGVDCIWVINTPENTQMKLDFDMFELQASDNCENDWLEVRNGGSEKSPLINKYCGTLIPRQIPSFTHQMRIHFHSDNFINARGFQIHWAVYSNGCGGNINADSGVIASPRYPNPYPHNAECDWHIQVPKGSSIHFTIEDLSIEELFNCHYDFLEIFNGRNDMHPLLAKLCQLERDEPKQLYTTSNEALLRFRTDGSQRERGFLLSYYTNCSRTITDITGVIESPNYGNPYFKDPINCSWTIQAPKGNKIVLQFSHYEKSEGGHDLTFKEPGKNETLFHLLSLNENYTTTGNVLNIIQNTTWMNFRLEYAMFGCVQVFHRATGEFESPNHPLPYPNDIECMWEIKTTPGQGVELTITDLDIEETVNCTHDALVISSHMNSTNNKERHCGRQDSLVITSSSHQLYVRFISNKEHNGKGFKASYKILKSQCGGVLASKNGVITSPNYPLNYPPDARCEWTIEVNPHHTITLTLEEIEMENYYSCEMDFVEAYESANSDSDRPAQEAQEKLLFKECGYSDSTQNEWVTTTNTAVVRFESDDSMQEKGFKLSYKENCGQNILLVDDDVGYLAISRNAVTNETCEWHLVAKDLSKHVQFTPIHVQLSPLISLSAMLEEDCIEQGVKIYDGVDRTAPLRSKFCKTHPANVISNGHALTITVPMNVTTEFEGYYQLTDNWCGGYYMSLSGKFASPYYPSSYPVNIDCEWYIVASEGNSIVLTIEAFDTELSDGCNKDYLEVRESTESGRLMGLFCGSNIPSPITGLQTVWIKFGSDNDVVGNGFIASYNYATHNELNGKNGTIQSPHYPTKFRTDEPYTWRITVDKEYVLLLLLSHIIDVDMPFIKIYDGYSDIGLQIDYSNTHYVHSSTNIVYIKSYRGPFQIDWSTISKEDFKNNQTLEENAALCGRNSYSIDKSIFINSPGYPDGYAPSLNCSWVLMPKNPATHVVLQIAKVDLEDISECSADYITISASSDMQNWEEPARFCNKKEQEFKDYHGNPYLRLSFVTDSSVNKTGFSTSAHVECGAVMNVRQALVNLTEILSGSNRFQTECVWKINVRQSRRIRIRFLESNLAPDNQVANCRTYFLLRNGLAEDSPFLGKGKYCENNIADVLETTSNRAFIKLSRINLGPNFKAAFHYEEITHECSDMLVLSEDTPADRTKTINSPSYPNIPNPHTECIWRVTAPMHHIIAIEFKDDFDLVPSDSQSGTCDREYVQLNDGATELMPMIGLFCGKTKPNTKFTTGNVLRVKYYTDISEPHVGFQAVVSIGRCGGSYYEPDGEIVSPDSTLVKDAHDFECVYTIEVERGSTIKLVVEKMELPDTEGCSTDSNLELQEIVSYDGADNVTDSLRICGSRKNRNYVVESSKLVIRYHIKEFRPTHTFKLTYTSIGTRCGETITAPRGTLFTPGYPQGVTRPTHCAWKIRVPKGKRVKVEILDFDIGAGLNVTNSFGHSSSFRGRLSFANDFEMQSIITRVTTNPPAAVYSTDNIMAIDAFLLSFTQHRGFRLRFSSDEDSQVCQHNVRLANGEGVMHFRRNNDSDIYCSYMLKMQDNQTLTLAVEKYERNATSALYVSFCGYMSPLKLELNTQQILPELLCKNETHAVARLPYPVTMKLMGNRRNRLTNLELKYKVYECGGIRSIYNDLNITEPQMANYSGVLECAWAVWPDHEFSVDDMDDLDYWAAGTQIEVSLSTDFKDNCEDQYLLVYGGPNQNFPHLGRFCTQSSMENMVVERGVFVEYYTRNYETQSKFNLTLKQGSGCGGTLTYPFRPITFSDQYKNNIECVWTLSTEAGFHIGLHFTDRFFIETSKNCTKDYLLVQQKTTNGSWEDLGRYCGREPPQSVNSTTTEMRLIFRTDADTLGDGFTANFERNCGGILYATAEQQYIVSPGYPVRYPNNLNCNYTVIPKEPIKTGVLVDFVDFEIESPPITRCLFDNVTVYTQNDGNIAETVHCGTQRAHGFRGDQVSVILRTDHSFASRGFKLAYSTNVCGYTVRNTTMIETPRQFTDGTFPPNTECFWNLTAPDDYKILIKFEFFDYEGDTNCDFDGVKIYKSLYPVENERIAKFCGNLTGIIPPLHIPGNRGLIHTYSDRSINSVGFKALITFIPNCDQKIHLDANNATYDFTKYANGYANNLDCAYIFTTTSGRQLFADFNSFHVEESAKCQDDFLEMRDGGGPFGDLIGQFCGHVVPARMMSSQNALFMRFVSDSAETSAGFSLKISSTPKICGNMELEVKSKEKLVLKSPNTGQQLYGKHLSCLWKLKSTRTIHLKFEHMDLEGSNVTGQCGGDTLRIYNKEDAYEVERGYGTEVIHNGQMGGGQWSNYATNHVYCGNQLPDDYYSTGNTLIIKFQTDDEIEKTGFTLAAYAVEGCFRNFTGTQGFVQLADTTDECDVYIEAPQNYTLSLYYSDVIFAEYECVKEYVEVFDSHTNSSLQKICSYTGNDKALFSNTNKLRIHLKMSGYYTRFEFTYLASQDGPGCGGNIYNTRGTIVNPFYPNNVRNNSDCRWNIRVPANLHILLSFDEFDLGTKNTCHSDYLEVIERDDDGTEDVVRRFCGGDNPKKYKSTRSSLSIRFHKTVNYDGTGWVINFSGVFANYKIPDYMLL